ncbi:PAS domain S-box protein [Anaerolineae bacterium CFX9]|nr:PAS domain S-box protein [Anaerolineae bacterium CFX9]
MSAEKGRSLKRWARRLRHWWCLLSNPAPNVTQPEVRFRSRLLAQTLLIAILIAVLSSVISLISAVIFRQQVTEQVILALVTAVEMALVYLISRRRNFETAVVLISAVITSQIAISAVLLSESGSLRVYYFLAVVVMFGALFMPPRQLIAMVIVHLLILFTAPLYITEVTVDDLIRGPANFYLVIIGLTFLSMYVRNRIEEMRSEQIIRSEQTQRNLFNSMSDIVASMTPDGRIISINAAGTAVLGVDQENLEAKLFAAFIYPEDHPVLETMINQLLAGEKPSPGQVRLMQPGTEPLWVEMNASPIMVGKNIDSITIVSRDISDRKQAEERTLRQALERERRDTAISIVHAISHDFRNRLATIETSRYLLERALGDTGDPKLIARLETIQKEVTHLTQQIENLRMVETLVQPQTTECDLDIVMIRIIEEFSPRAEIKGIVLSYSAEYTDSAALPHIAADPEELLRAMRQLVLNAIAHTPAGGVITLRAVSQPDGTVCAEVSDNGEGIAPEHLPHIFEPFYRPDHARTTDRGGVGLGLSIVRMIVEAYGGRVIAESTPGKGSRFRLCFRALRKPPSLPEVEHPA